MMIDEAFPIVLLKKLQISLHGKYPPPSILMAITVRFFYTRGVDMMSSVLCRAMAVRECVFLKAA
jgi:hypothetical protein